MKRKMFIAGMVVMCGVFTVLGCGNSDMGISAETVVETNIPEESETILEELEETNVENPDNMTDEELLEYYNGGDVGSDEWYQENYESQLTEDELYAIDGGDALYWKYYDAEGNRIDNAQDSVAEKAMENINLYRELSNDINAVKVYDSSELTYEILNNRNGSVIVEKTIGIVLDSGGNGKQLNPYVEGQDYIHYTNIPAGSVVLTVFVYNPETNAEDDILIRADYVLDEIK